jgi:hypothetical protein
MRYYVVGEDGNRYGPADEALLEAWAREGRITPHSYLDPENGAPRVLASTMANLQFPPVRTPYAGVSQPASSPSLYAAYAPTYAQPNWNSSEVRASWLLGFVALGTELLCGIGLIFAVLALVCAGVGLVRGRKAGGALTLALVVIGLHLFLNRA